MERKIQERKAGIAAGRELDSKKEKSSVVLGNKAWEN